MLFCKKTMKNTEGIGVAKGASSPRRDNILGSLVYICIAQM